MFITALFIIAKKWKLKCPSSGKWINSVEYPNYGILFSHKKEQRLKKKKKRNEDTKDHILYDLCYGGKTSPPPS